MYIAVANAGLDSRAIAVGNHLAAVGLAERALTRCLGSIVASLVLTCDMGLTYLKVPKPQPHAMPSNAPMLMTDIWERLLLGPCSLLCAVQCPALAVEGAMSVGRVSRIDAEGCVLIPRGLTGVFLAVRGVSPDPSNGVIDVPSLTARHPAMPVGVVVYSHRVCSSEVSRARHEGLDDVDVSIWFDRSGFRFDIGMVQQCP